MVDQRVDQRAGPIARAGMDDQPGRLVDDDQLWVLVEESSAMSSPLGSAGSGSGKAILIVSPRP